MLSERYISEKFLPDKAIDIIDEAGSKANLENEALARLTVLRRELKRLTDEKDAIENDDSIEYYKKMSEYKTREEKMTAEISELEKSSDYTTLNVGHIAAVIENMTKIPVQKITELESRPSFCRLRKFFIRGSSARTKRSRPCHAL